MENKNGQNPKKVCEGLFQSYRWTNDPVVVKLDESKVPKHIKDRLEAMKLKYLNQNYKTFRNSKNS